MHAHTQDTEYNGCFAACPDPIDFRAYTVIDPAGNLEKYGVSRPDASAVNTGVSRTSHAIAMARGKASRSRVPTSLMSLRAQPRSAFTSAAACGSVQ